VGATVIFIVAALLVIYCLREKAIWQAVMWGTLLVPYSALAIFAPHWSVLWGLGVSLLTLGILFIPGVVLPHGRALLTAAIMAAIVLHTVLAMTVWSHGVVFLAVIGLIAVTAGSILLSQSARPWEVRRSQRQAGRLAITLGVVLIAVGLLAPGLSKAKTHLSTPQPIASMWETIVNHTEKWAISSKRSLIGERAKTEALSELEAQLKQAHQDRWQRGIQRIPESPLSPQEWKELGVEQDP
jgi:hypothetical protein